MAVLWVVAPCCLVGAYRRFRGSCYLHHQGNFYQTTRQCERKCNYLHIRRRENLKYHTDEVVFPLLITDRRTGGYDDAEATCLSAFSKYSVIVLHFVSPNTEYKRHGIVSNIPYILVRIWLLNVISKHKSKYWFAVFVSTRNTSESSLHFVLCLL
jgi:hypothetical protein